MRKFLIRISVFALLVVMTLAIGETVVRSMPNPYRTKHQGMIMCAGDVETIILGSSHSYYGVYADSVERSYNLANVSQIFKYDYLLLKQYAENCKNLHTVVIPMSYCSLFDPNFETNDDWWYVINYVLYMDVDATPNKLKYYCEVFHMPAFREKLRALVKTNYLECDSLGFGVNYKLENRDDSWDKYGSMAAKRHTASNWDFLEENIYYLEEIIKFCQSRGVDVVLVTLPAWHSYYENLDERQLAKMYEVTFAMCKKYGLRYYDYMKDKRFVTDDFFDCDHMSDVGAKKFTSILKKEVLNGN